MNNDAVWQALLARSASTFTADTIPPYGFVTALNARLRSERGQVAEFERIGWRALLASVGVLAIAVAVTTGVRHFDKGYDFEPGVRNVVQMENISIS